MTADHSDDLWVPRHSLLIAAVIYLLPVLLLCYPIAQGYFLGGGHSDQFVAGYAFRKFGAEYFLAHGSVPQWNPYLFGGMPFIAGMHGDIFYPTAWLRLLLPVGSAMALGMALHLFVAGLAMYGLLRGLRLSWPAALVGGAAYELSGIVASQVQPGHDGKLFVAALAPLLLLALLKGIREGRHAAFGVVALLTGLVALTPHPQMTYYLLVAAGLWSLWLAFFDRERTARTAPTAALALALAAVLLGVAIAALQYVPFYEYIPYSARSVNAGWEYATGFAMPVEELVGAVIPQFNGLGPDAYWGQNFFKLHAEYLGVSVVILALIGAGGWRRQRALLPLAVIAALFLLVALGAHTPFYRVWYEVMPFMKKVRAAGMAFFLVALFVAVLCGVGVDRLVRQDVTRRWMLIAIAGIGLLAFLAASGLLQSFALAFADPRMADRVIANAGALQLGGIRALVVVLATGGAVWAMRFRAIPLPPLALGLTAIVLLDLGLVLRPFFVFQQPSSVLFGDDPITRSLDSLPKPYRVLDPASSNAVGVPSTYPGSWLMTHDIPNAFGYHGNEEQVYDALWGGKNIYSNLANQNLWSLWAVNHVILPGELDIPGFALALGPVETAVGGTGYLYRRVEAEPYARVVPAALKLPEDRIVPTVLDQRFPFRLIVVLPDSSSAAVPPLNNALPSPSARTASVTRWSPGHMTVQLEGQSDSNEWLLIAETWYKDWHARVDNQVTPVYRGDGAQLAVPVGAGSREVELEFRSADYATGRMISMLALIGALAWTVVPLARRRPRAAA